MIDLYKLHSDPEQLLWYDQKDLMPINAFVILTLRQPTKLDRKRLVKSIMKSPEYAYYYARDLMGARWPDAEPGIMKDPKWAYLYTREVINHEDDENKSRWDEAEPVIMKSPTWAYLYARVIIRDRWYDAEQFIKQDPEMWKHYKDYFNIR